MRRRFSLGDRALWLAQPKSIPFSDELYDLPDIGICLEILLQFLDPLLQRAVFTKELIDRLLHGLDLASREPAAFQSNKIEAGEVSSIAFNATKRNDIAFDTRRAANHCKGTNTDELVHRREPADNDMITHPHVPAEGCVIGHDNMAPNQTVMRDVRSDHKQGVIPDDSP